MEGFVCSGTVKMTYRFAHLMFIVVLSLCAIGAGKNPVMIPVMIVAFLALSIMRMVLVKCIKCKQVIGDSRSKTTYATFFTNKCKSCMQAEKHNKD